MLLENLGWGDGGKGDAIGRNAFAYICWPNQTWLKTTILRCVRQSDNSFIQTYRYPEMGADTMSRDHVGAIIIALYVNGDYLELNWILDNLPWRLSRKYSQTIDFWLWQKSLKYNSWWISQVFLITVIIQLIFIIPWNFIVRTILGVKKVKLEDLPFEYLWRDSWKSKVHKLIYPHYALFLLAWQVKIMPNSWLKTFVNWLGRIESGNVVIDWIFGKRRTQKDYDSYKPTSSFVWARRLDTADDVELRPLTNEESKFNDLNRGMLDYLWFEIDKINPKLIQWLKKSKSIIQY